MTFTDTNIFKILSFILRELLPLTICHLLKDAGPHVKVYI